MVTKDNWETWGFTKDIAEPDKSILVNCLENQRIYQGKILLPVDFSRFAIPLVRRVFVKIRMHSKFEGVVEYNNFYETDIEWNPPTTQNMDATSEYITKLAELIEMRFPIINDFVAFGLKSNKIVIYRG